MGCGTVGSTVCLQEECPRFYDTYQMKHYRSFRCSVCMFSPCPVRVLSGWSRCESLLLWANIRDSFPRPCMCNKKNELKITRPAKYAIIESLQMISQPHLFVWGFFFYLFYFLFFGGCENFNPQVGRSRYFLCWGILALVHSPKPCHQTE